MNQTINAETQERIVAMREGGEILAQVRQGILDQVKPGITFEEIEQTAQELILKHKAVPSFPTVDNYSWATCINKNSGCCHGIPQHGAAEFGDLLTIDVGLIWKGFHSDTSVTISVGKPSARLREFLQIGLQSEYAAIQAAKVGNSIHDISEAMAEALWIRGCKPIYQLVGHGIGRSLHESPAVPCTPYPKDKKKKLKPYQTLAIEVMYAAGNPKLELAEDGWTYQTEDGSLTGMFEHTVLITPQGPEILTLPLEASQKQRAIQEGRLQQPLEITDLF